jgi:hypothetical protein
MEGRKICVKPPLLYNKSIAGLFFVVVVVVFCSDERGRGAKTMREEERTDIFGKKLGSLRSFVIVSAHALS